MYRIRGISELVKSNTVVVINKVQGVELDFDFPKMLDKISVLDTSTVELDNNYKQELEYLVIITNTHTLDRRYKFINSFKKTPVLLVLTSYDGVKFSYEIVSNGRISGNNIEYIKKFKAEQTNEYKLKCIMSRVSAGMYFIEDIKFVKLMLSYDMNAVKGVVIDTVVDYIKYKMLSDKKFKKALDNVEVHDLMML